MDHLNHRHDPHQALLEGGEEVVHPTIRTIKGKNMEDKEVIREWLIIGQMNMERTEER